MEMNQFFAFGGKKNKQTSKKPPLWPVSIPPLTAWESLAADSVMEGHKQTAGDVSKKLDVRFATLNHSVGTPPVHNQELAIHK